MAQVCSRIKSFTTFFVNFTFCWRANQGGLIRYFSRSVLTRVRSMRTNLVNNTTTHRALGGRAPQCKGQRSSMLDVPHLWDDGCPIQCPKRSQPLSSAPGGERPARTAHLGPRGRLSASPQASPAITCTSLRYELFFL